MSCGAAVAPPVVDAVLGGANGVGGAGELIVSMGVANIDTSNEVGGFVVDSSGTTSGLQSVVDTHCCAEFPPPHISDGQSHPRLKNTNKKTTHCILSMSKIQPERDYNQDTAFSSLLNLLIERLHSD